MKKKANNPFSLRLLATRLSAWIHQMIEKKAEHLTDCAWYPGPCQTEYPF